MNIKEVLLSFLKELFSLNKFLSSFILLWIYRIGLGVVIIAAIVSTISDLRNGEVAWGLFTFFIGFPLAIVVWRVWIEMLYLLFGIYDRLVEIKEILKEKNPPSQN